LSRRLLLATRNAGKLRELFALFAGSGIALDTLAEHPGAPDVEEHGETFEENACLKASAAARATGLWALGEDSGLEVEALGGAPGVRSARFAGAHGDDEANNSRLLRDLAGQRDRRARYVCALALAGPDGRVVETLRATCEGHILDAPRGSGGFGYDPLFRPLDHERSMAEIEPAEKDALSHRGRAIRALLPRLARHDLAARAAQAPPAPRC
jgi:XTP/dITP diphosphohydrolase